MANAAAGSRLSYGRTGAGGVNGSGFPLVSAWILRARPRQGTPRHGGPAPGAPALPSSRLVTTPVTRRATRVRWRPRSSARSRDRWCSPWGGGSRVPGWGHLPGAATGGAAGEAAASPEAFQFGAGQGLMRHASTQSNGQLDMLALLRCIWHLSLASHAPCFSRNWNGAMDPVPFVPAMKLCLGGGDSAAEAAMALNWQRRHYQVGTAEGGLESEEPACSNRAESGSGEEDEGSRRRKKEHTPLDPAHANVDEDRETVGFDGI
jgi:hypothetical protein